MIPQKLREPLLEGGELPEEALPDDPPRIRPLEDRLELGAPADLDRHLEELPVDRAGLGLAGGHEDVEQRASLRLSHRQREQPLKKPAESRVRD